MAEKIITEAELQSMTKTKLQELAKSCDISWFSSITTAEFT